MKLSRGSIAGLALGLGVVSSTQSFAADHTLERFQRPCSLDQVVVYTGLSNPSEVIVEAHETKRFKIGNRDFDWTCRQGNKRRKFEDSCPADTNVLQVHRSGKGGRGVFEFKCFVRR